MTKRTGIQLCYPFEERRLTDHKFGWTTPYLVQPKLDGVRARSIQARIECLQSSTAAYLPSVPHIEEAIKQFNEVTGNVSLLDGELYVHGMTFSEIESIACRTVNLHDDYYTLEYHVFDIISPLPDRLRQILLDELFATYNRKVSHTPIKRVKTIFAYSLHELYEHTVPLLTDGYEGFIVRHKDAPYIQKRSNKILKFKPKKNDIYQIVDVLPAISQTGEVLDMAGTFVCVAGEGQQFNVGAGKLRHVQRREILQNKDIVIGNWLNVRYQALTDANRVPRFGIATQIVNYAQNEGGYNESFES